MWKKQGLFGYRRVTAKTNNMGTLNKKIKQLHKEFVKNNGNEPKFAEVVVRWDGDSEEDTIDSIIKLKDFDPRNTENDIDDSNVIFYADGIAGLCQVNGGGNGFTITDIVMFCDEY